MSEGVDDSNVLDIYHLTRMADVCGSDSCILVDDL